MRFEPKPSFFAASCCSVLVLNGSAGFLRRSRRLMSVTSKVFRPETSVTIACALASFGMSGLLPSTWCSFAVNGWLSCSSAAAMVQYSVAVNARISRSRSTSSRSATVCTRPAESPFLTVFQSTGTRLVADEPVEHAASLLRVHLLLVDVAGVRDRARMTASFVISWKSTRRIGGAALPLIWLCTCHAMASPSRSGSVAMNTARADFAAALRSATVFSLPGMVTYSGSKPSSRSMPSVFVGRSRMCPTVALTL